MRIYIILLFILLSTGHSLNAQIDTLKNNNDIVFKKNYIIIKRIALSNRYSLYSNNKKTIDQKLKKYIFQKVDTVVVEIDNPSDKGYKVIKDKNLISRFLNIYFYKVNNDLLKIGFEREIITDEGIYLYNKLYWIEKKNKRPIRLIHYVT